MIHLIFGYFLIIISLVKFGRIKDYSPNWLMRSLDITAIICGTALFVTFGK